MILNNRIKDAFAAVHAEDNLKRDTKDFLSTRTASTVKSGNPIRLKRAVAFACLALILMIFGGWRFYMTPVSAISVDVNPSLELGVNRLDRVVAVDGYNDDGTDLAAFVDLRNLNYSDALEVLLNSQAMQSYMAKNDPVSITVIGSTKQKSEEMFARIRSCGYAKSPNVECHLGSHAEAAAAHEAGMSYGKYQVFLELQVLDSEITAHDIQNWTMRQIRDRINELSDGPNEPSSGNGFGGHGGGSGHGGNESSPGGRQNRGNN